jgi:hypothetical protein
MSSIAHERRRAELAALALIEAALDVASAALIAAHPELM